MEKCPRAKWLRLPAFLSATRQGTKVAAAVVAITVFVSLWLRAAYPPLGLWGEYDDVHFIRLAGQLGSGHWLGTYDTLTLVKGPFYPLFILANKATGLPLKITEHLIYLSAVLTAAFTFARLARQSWLLLPAFVLLALSPTPWMIEGGARVVREALYQSLSVAIFSLAAHYLLNPGRKGRWGPILGFLAGFYWLTREEGIWLLPSLSVIALPCLAERANFIRKAVAEGIPSVSWLRDLALLLFIPAAAFLLVILAVSTTNFFAYGVFRNNDLRSGPFPQAYGALARIKHDHWKRYVIFPRDARQRAYSASPAARELIPYLEGEVGKRWATANQGYPAPWGCANEPAACNDEILSAWFVWALRDAVAAAGHYRTAPLADAYYARLADEINAACDRGDIPCHPPHASLAPIWRDHYLSDALTASNELLKTLLHLNDGHVGVPPSPITAEQARIFQRAINSEVSGFDSGGTRGEPTSIQKMRLRLTEGIAAAYAKVSLPLFALALCSYVFLLIAWLASRSCGLPTPAIAFLTGLLVAVLVRVGMLGFLEATSIPSNNMLYLLPAVPFYLLFVVLSTGLACAVIRDMIRGRGHLPA